MVGTLLCRPLFYGRRIRIHQSSCFQVEHCWQFSSQCDLSCPPASLLPASLLSHTSPAFLILRQPHHPTHLLFSSASCLSATSLLLLSRSPHVSATVSADILIHSPWHLACLIPLSLSTCVSPANFVRRHLHHPAYLSLPSLFPNISSVSLMSLSPSSHISAAVDLPSCAPPCHTLLFLLRSAT